MPKDHYVAQTYLKHFLDPKLGNLLHAYDKKGLKHFTARTRDICYAHDWDTNPYFQDQRAIDKYLKVIEPKWNYGVTDIHNLLKYEEIKYFMAGYIAVLVSCTPTSIRTLTHATEEMIASAGNILACQMQQYPERFPDSKPLPPDIFEQIMAAGGLKAKVDPKHTHARTMQNLLDLQWHFYKSPWMILDNETENPFLTSDYPVAYYYSKPQARIPYRFVPICPRYAILIKPSLDKADRKSPKEPFDKYPITETDICSIRPKFPKILNKLTIQGAERFIISAYDTPWIMKLVKKYKNWKMDSGTVRLPHENGELIVSRNMPREQAA